MAENIAHVQVRFITKQEQYSVADTPFSVPASVGVPELNELIHGLLKDDQREECCVEFDFLVNGEFLRVTLDSHMLQKNISTETVVEIEYVERHPAPEPENSLSHDDWVSCIHARGDFILSGSYDNTVRVWHDEGLTLTIPGHMAPVKCCSWLKQDGEDSKLTFITGSHDETLLLWQWNKQNNSVDVLHVCKGHAGSVDCVTVSPSQTRFCSGSWDKMLKIWSTECGEDEGVPSDQEEKPKKKKKTDSSRIPTKVPIMTFSGHGEGISSTAWLSENEICTASWDHSIRIWDLDRTMQKATVNGNKVFLDISYSPLNGTLVTASADRHIRLYDPRVTDGAVVKCTFTSHSAWVSGVAWSPSNENLFISGGYDAVLKLWDTRSPKAPLYNMSGHEDKILAVDWSEPKYMLSGGADNHLKVFKHTDFDEKKS